jgi:hypothetical protein
VDDSGIILYGGEGDGGETTKSSSNGQGSEMFEKAIIILCIFACTFEFMGVILGAVNVIQTFCLSEPPHGQRGSDNRG